MKLIIVESPTKAKTLSRFLGDGFTIEATMGHIKDLPKSTLGVDVNDNFKPEYVPVKKRNDSVKKIKSSVQKSDSVYIATDPDREGEAIAAHVAELIPKGKYKRIVFHEITKDAVLEAMDNPREVDESLANAQVARR